MLRIGGAGMSVLLPLPELMRASGERAMIYDVESLTAEFRGRTTTIDRSRPEGLEWPVCIGSGAVPQDWRDLAELAANVVGFAWMGVAEIWDAGDRVHEVVVLPGDGGLAEVELLATLMDKHSETRHPLAVRAVVRERAGG